MNVRRSVSLSIAVFAAATSAALASNYTVNWLDMSPTPYGSSITNGGSYNLPGYGPVTVTYSLPTTFTHNRSTNGDFLNGSVTSGPDTWSWNHYEYFAAILNTGPDPLVPVQWRVTYHFPTPVPAGQIALGVVGLGQTTSFGGGASIASVTQNGTFLGDFANAGNYGPTQFNPGVPFSMQNSLNGPGGIDPWWNTPLGVVRIDDPLNMLVVDMSTIRGDGVGLNIGYIVPTPASATLLALGGLFSSRRRRTT